MRILVAGMVLVLTLAVSMMVAVNTDAQGKAVSQYSWMAQQCPALAAQVVPGEEAV